MSGPLGLWFYTIGVKHRYETNVKKYKYNCEVMDVVFLSLYGKFSVVSQGLD